MKEWIWKNIHHQVDAADSDCRGPHGDSHIPGAYEAGDLTREEEMEVMYGNREERQRLVREADEILRQEREARREVNEMIRQREQARGSEDVDLENHELLEASTTPTSLEEPQFYTNMVDELRDGVDPFSRIVIEAAMEASNLALSTNGDDLEVMMRIIRDTAMEAHQEERTPRQRLRIWRRRFRARLEGCGIWQRSLTQAEMRERSRSRTTRGSRRAQEGLWQKVRKKNQRPKKASTARRSNSKWSGTEIALWMKFRTLRCGSQYTIETYGGRLAVKLQERKQDRL